MVVPSSTAADTLRAWPSVRRLSFGFGGSGEVVGVGRRFRIKGSGCMVEGGGCRR